jgi:hypothetical protein
MGTGAWFAPHTHTTAIGTIAGIVTVGDQGETLKPGNEGRRDLFQSAKAFENQNAFERTLRVRNQKKQISINVDQGPNKIRNRNQGP